MVINKKYFCEIEQNLFKKFPQSNQLASFPLTISERDDDDLDTDECPVTHTTTTQYDRSHAETTVARDGSNDSFSSAAAVEGT